MPYQRMGFKAESSSGEEESSAEGEISWDDATWLLFNAFFILTMQTGFGLLESGCVSLKNQTNIMMKNVIDIVFGGLTYWIFGYGLTYGKIWSCPVFAVGYFAVDADVEDMGELFTKFFFQLSFATTATTIVSGAIAERFNFKAYCIFSLFNTIVYCIPAGWIWGDHGFLNQLGAVDIAGSGPIHLIGGSSALIACIMIGPRLGRYDRGNSPLPMSSPSNVLVGLFILWWGWLSFNSGSVGGVTGHKWEFCARAAVSTIVASFGGGVVGILWTLFMKRGRVDVLDVTSAILGSLVSVTGGCAIYRPWHAIIIGIIGGVIACVGIPFFDWLHIDDPVGATSVHGLSGIWGVIAIGFFADGEEVLELTHGRAGVFYGGGGYLLGVQALTALCFIVWSMLSNFILLWLINLIVPIRMQPHEELIGADLAEHGIRHGNAGVTPAVSVLGSQLHLNIGSVYKLGTNPGHELTLEKYFKNLSENRKGELKRSNSFSGWISQHYRMDGFGTKVKAAEQHCQCCNCN